MCQSYLSTSVCVCALDNVAERGVNASSLAVEELARWCLPLQLGGSLVLGYTRIL